MFSEVKRNRIDSDRKKEEHSLSSFTLLCLSSFKDGWRLSDPLEQHFRDLKVTIITGLCHKELKKNL